MRRPFPPVSPRATAETLVLVALFAAAPPVLAIGLYFCLWHSLRHILRLMAIDPVIATLLAHGRLLRASGRFAARAAPLTVAALLLLAVVDVALPHARTAAGLSGIYLVLVSALTVPHLSIVATMDVATRRFVRLD